MLLHWLLLLYYMEAFVSDPGNSCLSLTFVETMADYLVDCTLSISRTFHSSWQLITMLFISLVDFYKAAAKHYLIYPLSGIQDVLELASCHTEYPSLITGCKLLPALLIHTKGPIRHWITGRKIRKICIIITFPICLIFIYIWYLIQGRHSNSDR